jgi:hypothetical protein
MIEMMIYSITLIIPCLGKKLPVTKIIDDASGR